MILELHVLEAQRGRLGRGRVVRVTVRVRVRVRVRVMCSRRSAAASCSRASTVA